MRMVKQGMYLLYARVESDSENVYPHVVKCSKQDMTYNQCSGCIDVCLCAFVLDREMRIGYDDIQKTEYAQLRTSSVDRVR